MTIYWTDDALDHVTAIGEYLRLTSISHSEATVDRFFDRTRQLEDNPYLGPVYPKANLQKVRQLLVGNYRIIYYVGRNQIDILAVMCNASAHNASAPTMKKASPKLARLFAFQ